jgi:ubiquinone/menaquinone biosynthesis C-methylase UbiE
VAGFRRTKTIKEQSAGIKRDGMYKSAISIKEWEEAEVKRSAVEATRSREEILPSSEQNIARYLNPPADTPFPLEYSFHLLGDVRGKCVLDLGCGSGVNSALLARRGAKVHAVDISEELVELAKRRVAVNNVSSDVSFIIASAYDIPLPDESVDVVFGAGILHHLDLKLVAREVRRLLRKGGRAIFKEPVRNSRFISYVRRLIPYRSSEVSPFERPLTDQELEAFAECYRRYSSKAFALPHISLCRLLPLAQRYEFSLYRLDRAILNRFQSLDHYATVKVIEMIK